MVLLAKLGNVDKRLVFLLVLTTFVQFYNISTYPKIFFDEGVYLSRAHYALESGDFTAGYSGSAFFSESLYDHPFLSWLIVASVFLFNGFSFFHARFFTAFLGVLDSLVVFLLAKQLFGDEQTAYFGALFFAVSNSRAVTSRWVIVDNFMLFFFLVSVFLLFREKTRASGLFFGFSLLCKYSAAVFFPFFLWTLLRRKRNVWSFLFPCATVFLAWPLYAAASSELPDFFYSILWQAGRGFKDYAEFLIADWPLLAAGTVAQAKLVSEKKFELPVLFSCFAFFVLLTPVLYPHYVTVFVPVLSLSAAYLFRAVSGLRKHFNTVFALLLVNALLVLSQDPLTPQLEALSFVSDNYGNRTILTPNTYGVFLQQKGTGVCLYDFFGIQRDCKAEIALLDSEMPAPPVPLEKIADFNQTFSYYEKSSFTVAAVAG